MSWYAYIVMCSDGTLYTGITNNIEARVAAHNIKKGAKYTASRVPVALKWSETFPSRSLATKREIQIKLLTKEEKITLINTGQ